MLTTADPPSLPRAQAAAEGKAADSAGSVLAIRSVKGQTPLEFACKNSRLEIATYMLDGAVPTPVEPRAYYSAMAAINSCLKKKSKTAHRLDDANAVLALVKAKGGSAAAVGPGNETALHLAAEAGDLPATRALLKDGADPNVAAVDGGSFPAPVTPLLLAAAKGKADICEALLKAGAEMDVRDADGNSPLHLAGGKARDEDTWQLLVSKGADRSASNKNGKGNAPVLKENKLDKCCIC